MAIEAPLAPQSAHFIDHRYPKWEAIVKKAIHAISFIQDEENNLRCARSMQLGQHEALIELPVPKITDPTLKASVAHVSQFETPHIVEPSVILEWETPGVDELPQREYIAVAIAHIIGDQIELQHTFDPREYHLVERTLGHETT